MIQFKNILLVFIFLVSAVSFSMAQQIKSEQPVNKYRAIHWGLEEGLSQANVAAMLKDVNGFLWLQTDFGLNRFDGNTFKIYLHDSKKSGTIAGDYIFGLVEDSLHNIWIGTDKGLSRYDIKADSFVNFSSIVIPFWATHDEVFCIEGKSLDTYNNKSVVTYNIHSFKKQLKAKLNPTDVIGGWYDGLYNIYDPSTNSVWFLRGDYKTGTNGLIQLSLFNGKEQSYYFPDVKKIPGRFNTAAAMKYDKKRNAIWVNASDGLIEFTLTDKKFHSIGALSELESLKDYNRGDVGIDIDLQGRIWFSTIPKGIVIYDPSNQSVTVPFPNNSVSQNEISVRNACIYCDRDNITWTGSWANTGFYQIVPFSPVVKNYVASSKKDSLSGYPVTEVADAGNAKIWVGTGNGINILDKKTETFRVLQKKDLPGIQTDNGFIDPIAIDTLLQKAWLATNLGFFRMDMLTGKSTPIIFKSANNLIAPNAVPKFDGTKFFLTAYDDSSQHIAALDLNNDTAFEILSLPGNSFDILSPTPVKNRLLFLKGYTDEKDNRTYENKNGSWVVVHTPIDSIRWTDITYLKEDNTYWVAGESQLFHFDSNFHIIQVYTAENGMPQLPVVGLTNDTNGNIWFHTASSIQELNVATGQIKTLSEADGFQMQSFTLFPFEDKDAEGNIYYSRGSFGNGLTKITPSNFISTTSIVYFKSFTVNQKAFPLKQSINHTDTLSLNYNQTKIEIETGIIDFYSKGQSRIRYKLEGNGLNEAWQYAPYYYTIRYEGLQPGNYELILQASNASNEFNGPEKKLFIHISSPFWQTWWFRLFVIAVASLIIVSIFQARIKKIRKDAFIQNQLKELEMKALKAQMNPHFIYNALNSIQALIANDKKEEGIHYIGSFSRLLRQVLENSENNIISLDKELETIGLYIQMETLRLDMQLHYNKIIQQDIVTEFEKIPPLILQPFVENALWHGLSRKEGNKQITISVSVKDDWLLCDITDNGIGRTRAQEWKSNSAILHQSKGIDITRKRLIDFNEDDKISPIEFFDLYDENKKPCGTHVTISIKRKSRIQSYDK